MTYAVKTVEHYRDALKRDSAAKMYLLNALLTPTGFREAGVPMSIWTQGLRKDGVCSLCSPRMHGLESVQQVGRGRSVEAV